MIVAERTCWRSICVNGMSLFFVGLAALWVQEMPHWPSILPARYGAEQRPKSAQLLGLFDQEVGRRWQYWRLSYHCRRFVPHFSLRHGVGGARAKRPTVQATLVVDAARCYFQRRPTAAFPPSRIVDVGRRVTSKLETVGNANWVRHHLPPIATRRPSLT